jgi:isopenicillin-N epimerase
MKARAILGMGAGAVSVVFLFLVLLVNDAQSSPDTREDANAVQFPPCRAIEKMRSPAWNNSGGPSLPIDRSLLYVPSTTSYFNAASLGPMVRDAASCSFAALEEFESDPTNLYYWGKGAHSAFDAVRAQAAHLLGCSPDELALTSSTTESLNLVGEGLVSSGYFKPSGDDWILTTDQEHDGGVSVWRHWIDAGFLAGIHKVALPVGASFTATSVVGAFRSALEFAKAAGRKISVISVSHVLTTTGARLPLSELSALAHDVGALLVVDGAQGAGNVHLDLEESGVDAYTVSAHKWLLAPTGSGLLYIRTGEAQKKIKPALLDGGFKAYKRSGGTVPYQTIAGFKYALDVFNAIGGTRATEEHAARLRDRTRRGIVELAVRYEGLKILSPTDEDVSSSLLTISLPSQFSKKDVNHRLHEEYDMVVKELHDMEGGSPLIQNCLRLSHHIYTDESDVDTFLNALEVILDSMSAEDGDS